MRPLCLCELKYPEKNLKNLHANAILELIHDNAALIIASWYHIALVSGCKRQ